MRRCFRYEYVVKTIFIFASAFTIILSLGIVQRVVPFLTFPLVLAFVALAIFYSRITTQRYHDLGFSSWQAFARSGFRIQSGLFTKNGEHGINEYDEAINYKKLFKGRHRIDIYSDILKVNGETYSYEKFLGKYSIRMSNYAKINMFTEYLQKNYAAKENQMFRTGPINKVFEIPEDDFNQFISKNNFIVVVNSLHMKIKDLNVFIRKEDFKYTIILDKYINDITKELLSDYNFPGLASEDEGYIYYKKINKSDFIMWAKYVA